MNAIEIRDLVVRFADTVAVDGVDLDVTEGQLLVIVGESGSGKTTLLRCINRLVDPDRGQIRLGGRDTAALDVVELRRSIGYVLQGIALFPHWTVSTNIGLVPRLVGWDATRIAARVDELLTLVGLDPDGFRDRLPDEMSGGQRQRVGLARALAAEPRVLLMDEPLGALDPVTRDALQTELRDLHDRLGLTTVMVTHDMAEALSMGDRIAVMKDGRVLAEDTPQQLFNAPPHPYVEALMQAPRRKVALLRRLEGT